MSFDKQANAQAVYDMLVDIRTLVDKIFAESDDLSHSRALARFDNANPQARLDGEILQLTQNLEKMASVLPKLITYTTDAGAKRRVIQREDVSSKDSGAMIDPKELVIQGFEMFPPDVKKETLQRLFDCVNDPPKALGQDGVDTVVALFKILHPEEKKELFKRLIDL